MLKKFLDLGQQPLANSYLRKSQLKKKEKKLSQEKKNLFRLNSKTKKPKKQER